MNKLLLWSRYYILGLISVALPLAIQAQEDDEDIFELSPFSIEASEDDGYMAQTTLAGSRVRSNVRDLGSSIAIITQEFMQDTGATDGESLLMFVGNVEVGGVLGNFANVNATDSGTIESRVNPQRSQRIRGLVSANLTRDYFQTDIPFDAYNTSRVTINRGPNSILFGLGSPGGVINNTTNKAQIGAEFGQISIRVDANRGHRETLDINKTIIEDRLAIRVNILNENVKFRQEPALEDDTRFYIAWDAVLFENEGSDIFGKTIFRGSYEQAEIFRNPPDVVPPIDLYSAWWEGIGSQDDLNRYLSVPGVSLSDINNAAVTNAQVISAVNSGLATVPEGLTLEEYAAIEGQFIPKTLVDRFRRFDVTDPTMGGRNSTVRRVPYFLYPAINYNTVDAQVQGWDSPELAGIQGIMARFRPFVTDPNINRQATQDVAWSNRADGGISGFGSRSMDNRQVFDYQKTLLAGNTNIVTTDFDIKQFVLEQELFGGKAGFEIAWDRQSQERFQFTPFDNGGDKSISIDISPHHAPGDSNFDGIADRLANENVGRPVLNFQDTVDLRSTADQETFRATIFGTLDFRDFVDGKLGKILGSHTLTGLYEDRTNDSSFIRTRGAWWADNSKWPGSADISNGLSDNFRRHVRGQVYLGPDVRGFNSPDEVRIDGFLDGLTFPKVGDEYGIWYFDNNSAVDRDLIDTWRIIENIVDADIDRQELESKAFSLQSRFFDDHIVAMYGWREDTQTVFQSIRETQVYGDPSIPGVFPRRIDLPGINEVDGTRNMGLVQLENQPAQAPVTQDTATWSVVAKFPEVILGELPWGMDLTAHYYEAESFEPPGLTVDILNNTLPSPLGTTEEYGFTIELFDRRLSIRFNKFETVNANSQITDAQWGGLLDDIANIYTFIIDRITSAENDSATNLYTDGFIGFNPDGSRNFEEGTDAALTPDTTPNNQQRGSGTDADLGGFTSFRDYYDALINAVPPELQAVRNFRVVDRDGLAVDESDPLGGALRSRQDFVSKGTEVDVVGRITDNWSISLNVAQQETVTSNTGPIAIPLAEKIEDFLNPPLPNSPGGWSIYQFRDSPFQGETATARNRYSQEIRQSRIMAGRDNTVSQEQREWRVNLTLRYDFLEGFLKGLQVGGSLRYQDEVSAGYPNIIDAEGTVLPDVANPFFGPTELNGDLFVRYRRKLTDKIDWTVQFNARNLYRDRGAKDIPVTFSPDGTVAIVRIPNEQQFFLTNTFSF